jgi:pimeloyl-ACP methyl ester carboxylesterase
MLVLAAHAAALQAQSAAPIGYAVFLRGTPVGREEVTVQADATGTTVSSQGRLAPPLELVIRRAEFKYRPDWTPESFVLDLGAAAGDVNLRTSFRDGMAVTEGVQAGNKIALSHPVAPQAIVHANSVFGGYAALARRLATATAGMEYRIYVVPQAEIGMRVAAIHAERMQIGTSFLNVRRYDLVFANPGGDLAVSLTSGEDGTLVRLNIQAQALDVVREDVAASTSRTQIFSNPGDEAVTIPAAGFNIGATLTRPSGAGAAAPAPGRLPVAILLSGSGVGDRDGFALGVPTLAQLAGALAEGGIMAVRYDKRGYGQSGGRAESATLSDYAEDARAVVKWLAARKDVDGRRIALVGHSEGAWVALLAASRERRIAGVVSIAGPSRTGAELILEQQQHALDQMNLSDEERTKRVALQKQIQSAVLTGKGWDAIPPAMRKQADTPWFQSLLAFDAAKVIDDVRQPLLLVHGELDRQVPVAHADRLAELARKEGKSKSVDVVIVRGVNHLLTPATTGEVSEYATLPDRNVSKDVTSAIGAWLTRTFEAVK